MKKIESILRSGLNLPHPFVMATIIDTGGSSPRDIGTKMIITGRHDFLGTIGGGVLEEMVILDAMESLQEKKPRKKSYSLGTKTGQCCGGVVEVFFEVFGISPRLFVFGCERIYLFDGEKKGSFSILLERFIRNYSDDESDQDAKLISISLYLKGGDSSTRFLVQELDYSQVEKNLETNVYEGLATGVFYVDSEQIDSLSE